MLIKLSTKIYWDLLIFNLRIIFAYSLKEFFKLNISFNFILNEKLFRVYIIIMIITKEII